VTEKTPPVVRMAEQPPSQKTGDFCNDLGCVAWEYPAQDVNVYFNGDRVLRMSGNWGACEQCAILIDRGDYEALARRTVGKAPGATLAGVSAIQSESRRNRTGPRTRVAR
jgi:hypothetical protein